MRWVVYTVGLCLQRIRSPASVVNLGKRERFENIQYACQAPALRHFPYPSQNDFN